MPISIRILRDRLDRAFEKAPSQVYTEVRKEIRDISASFIDRFTQSRLTKTGDKVYGDTRKGLFTRSGALRRSFIFRMFGTDLDSLRSKIGWLDSFAATIAGVHEYGATISGRPYLTVPLPGALTPSGVLRRNAREYSRKQTFVRPSSKNPEEAVIFLKRGKKAIPLFLLKKQVVIPPRLEFLKTATSREETSLRLARINFAITRALGKVVS